MTSEQSPTDTKVEEISDPIDRFLDQFSVGNEGNSQAFRQALAEKCEQKFLQGKFSQSTLASLVTEACMFSVNLDVQTFLSDEAVVINDEGYGAIIDHVGDGFRDVIESFQSIDPLVKQFISRTKFAGEIKDRLGHLPDGFDFKGDSKDEAISGFKHQLVVSMDIDDPTKLDTVEGIQ